MPQKKSKTTTKIRDNKFKKNKKLTKKTVQKTVEKKEFSEKKTFSEHKIFDPSQKRKIILILLILFVLVFFAYIYKTFIDPYSKKISNLNFSENIVENTGSVIDIYISDSKSGADIQDEIQISDKQFTILNFYNSINQQNFQNMEKYVDSYIKKSSVYQTYFGANRLQIFLNNLSENMFYISHFQELDEDPKKPGIADVNYKIQYKIIGNDSTFIEERTATLIKVGGEYKIGKIMCNTTGCSKMPFFNFQRHGIK